MFANVRCVGKALEPGEGGGDDIEFEINVAMKDSERFVVECAGN